MNRAYTVIGNGSFATALTKVLCDSNHEVTWWMRSEVAKNYLVTHQHNPHYLSQVRFDNPRLTYTNDICAAIKQGDVILFAVPSAFITQILALIPQDLLAGKKILSSIKGIVPQDNLLLNEYLHREYSINDDHYCCITGPCHAEEVAAEKLSYLTFSSSNQSLAQDIAEDFANSYLRTLVSQDVYGVQYAAILKNIYALGAGIAHGLDYGDNFLSVYNTNCFNELENFMTAVADHNQQLNTPHHYNSGPYLGDLLVTAYSLHSRNRRFGNMIGKGYSVPAAKLELNMVAEGYYASKCIHEINSIVKAPTPILDELYNILWENKSANIAFQNISSLLH
jgi:glycerol-3-phosphate dehydrogenase (NAD(P)+)